MSRNIEPVASGAASSDSSESETSDSVAGDSTASNSGRFQVSLRTILLLSLACAVWLAYWNTRVESQRLSNKLERQRLSTQHLVIIDPSQFAVVSFSSTLTNGYLWDVYVPELAGKTARVALAYDQVGSTQLQTGEQTEALESIELAPGRHTIHLQYGVDEQARLAVEIDGKPAIEIKREADLLDSRGYEVSSMASNASRSFPVHKAVFLQKRRAKIEDTGDSLKASNKRAPGFPPLMLWIDMQGKVTN